MITVNIYEAKAKLSELVARATAGEEVILARNGLPAVRLVPVNAEKMTLKECAAARGYGMDAGLVWIADDFDDPVPELEKFFT
jgi:prevent-host-death family protein